MKKIIGIVACAALVASSAFAGVNVGAWGRSGIHMIDATSTSTSETSGSKTTTTTTNDDPLVVKTPDPSWSGSSRVGVNFDASDEDGNIGFHLNVDSNGNIVGIGDQAKIWAKLFNKALEVQFGKIQLDDLRGSIGDWGDRDVGALGEDAVFPRFNPQNGMTVALRPIDGLFIGAAIDLGLDSKTNAGDPSDPAKDTYKAIDGGIGYTIKDVAQIKAAYFGSADTDNYGQLNAGVDLLMIANNTIEIGVTVPMAKDNIDFNAVVGIKGGADKLSYKGHVYGYFNNAAAATIADTIKAIFTAAGQKMENKITIPTIGLDAGLEYDLGIFTLGGTAYYNITIANWTGTLSGTGYTYSFNSSAITNNLGIEVYAKKGFSNGYLFAGVGDKMALSNGKDTATATVTGVGSATGTVTSSKFINNFFIPVGAEYFF